MELKNKITEILRSKLKVVCFSKDKLPFMDWVEAETLYDEDGLYIYKGELWSIEGLEKIHYPEYLSL